MAFRSSPSVRTDTSSARPRPFQSWLNDPHQTLVWKDWWASSLGLGWMPNTSDVQTWAERARNEFGCRQDVGEAVSAWGRSVQRGLEKPAWEHAADVEAVLNVVRFDPRLLSEPNRLTLTNGQHPDVLWSLWTQTSPNDLATWRGLGKTLALQASKLLVMAAWWRRSASPDERPDHWHGVVQPWSVTPDAAWVTRWSQRVIEIVQTLLQATEHDAIGRYERQRWIRWVDRMVFETWPAHGIDENDLMPTACAWHAWMRRKAWRELPLIDRTNGTMLLPALLRRAPPSDSEQASRTVVQIRPKSVVPELEWNDVPWQGWGYDPSHELPPSSESPRQASSWPRDAHLWWLHRKREDTSAVQAWNSLWDPRVNDQEASLHMLILSNSYRHGLDNLKINLTLAERWRELANVLRVRSFGWLVEDSTLASHHLRWKCVVGNSDDARILPHAQEQTIATRSDWLNWLGWNSALQRPTSLAWHQAWSAYKRLLHHANDLLVVPNDEHRPTWKQGWERWCAVALDWETTLLNLPGPNAPLWSHRFRERVSSRLLENIHSIPQDCMSMWDAWFNPIVHVPEWSASSHPKASLTTRCLIDAALLAHHKEPEFKAIAERCQPLWQGCALRPCPSNMNDLALSLNERFPWFEPITQRIARRVAMRHTLGSSLVLPTLLLVGPPGIGKTSYARALAQSLNLPLSVLGLNGMNDNRTLSGTARGYINMRPSWAVEFIAREACANPLLVLDEIDKVAQSQQNGRVWDTLLGLLERSSARQWFDECLQTPVDLSCVSWLATANELNDLPAALLSRMDVVTVTGPDWTNPSHQRAAMRHLRMDLATTWGVEEASMPWLNAQQEELLWKKDHRSLRSVASMVESWVENNVLQNLHLDRSKSNVSPAQEESIEAVSWHHQQRN